MTVRFAAFLFASSLCACGVILGITDVPSPLDGGSADAGDAGVRDAPLVDAKPCTAVPCVVDIAAGIHTCARIVDGTLRCWGRNETGELGVVGLDGSLVDPAWTSTPTEVTGLDGAAAVGLSSIYPPSDSAFTCALLVNGTVECWGSNQYSTMGRGGGGMPLSDPNPHARTRVNGLAGASRIGVGAAHACALVDGGVECWGLGSFGQLGRTAPFGFDDYARPTSPMPQGRNATQLAGGADHECAVLEDFTVACWGWNKFLQLGQADGGEFNPMPTRVAGIGADAAVTQVATGWVHSCAIANGDVWCWGDNGALELGHFTVDAGDAGSVEALPSQVMLPGGKHAVGIAAGYYYTCAVLEDGTVACWGSNSNGAAGLDTSTSQTLPALVDGLSGVAQVAVTLGPSPCTTCARMVDGTMKCWGANTYGQLGENADGGSDSLSHPNPQLVKF